jgi:uncharacterized Ntn-hydrolase superfamily protein
MTFSIVAHSRDESKWGVAVASKFLAVGAVVPWARANVGAVATQSYAKMSFGADGLALMAQGISAQHTLDKLIAADDNAAWRQVGMVDASGTAATFTGEKCMDWAGGRIGDGIAIQGNILVGEVVITAMWDAFHAAHGALEDRLLAALIAGDHAGGDKRGRQSAALLVVKPNGSYGGDTDRYLDLRVDDDPDPCAKLAGLVQAHHLFFGGVNDADRVTIESALAHELQTLMIRAGVRTDPADGIWDERAHRMFDAFIGTENLEERWTISRPDQFDRVALEYLRSRFGG